MKSRLILFDANSILKLMTHYGDGQVPLDAELRAAGVSGYFERWIGLRVRSGQWDAREVVGSGGGLEPLHFRYEGKKTLSWGDKHSNPVWQEAVEAPKQA